MSQDWVSDSDDSDKFELESDSEAESSWAPKLRKLDVPGPSMLVRQVVTDIKKMCISSQEPRLIIIMIIV
jgi:hypothetical protein